ncbi:hypothetical protein ZWY2020_056178 [Hordeum vulgare]|nr:hypothetical protein ZWY2020_056178 [Hordeum vulgare]
MATIFHERYGHTNFTKQQIQEKQKELKGQYRLIKDARKQGGVSWNYHTHMIEVDPHLWQNLIIVNISKFQTKPFPLYDKLGDLYDKHIVEGNFNFTSIEATQVSDDDPEVERDDIAFSFDLNQCEDDLHMCDDPRDAAQIDGPRGATQSDGPKDDTQSDVTRAGAPGGSNKKPVEEPKNKNWDDPMVEVMAKYVDIKRKQAMEESALFSESKNAQQFTMSKCIVVLYKMESISHGERSVAYKVIKNAESREIFLNAAAEDEVSAAMFLRSEMTDLPRGMYKPNYNNIYKEYECLGSCSTSAPEPSCYPKIC